jgi:hypothetical protein
MTSLPERTPKKITVLPIVALLSNGCKQAFPLLTVDLQRARHNIMSPISDYQNMNFMQKDAVMFWGGDVHK